MFYIIKELILLFFKSIFLIEILFFNDFINLLNPAIDVDKLFHYKNKFFKHLVLVIY